MRIIEIDIISTCSFLVVTVTTSDWRPNFGTQIVLYLRCYFLSNEDLRLLRWGSTVLQALSTT